MRHANAKLFSTLISNIVNRGHLEVGKTQDEYLYFMLDTIITIEGERHSHAVLPTSHGAHWPLLSLYSYFICKFVSYQAHTLTHFFQLLFSVWIMGMRGDIFF